MHFSFSVKLGRDRPTSEQPIGPDWCRKGHCVDRRCKKRHSSDEPHIVHHCGRQRPDCLANDSEQAKGQCVVVNSRHAQASPEKPAVANQQTACRLFNLPAEIRLTIYKLVFGTAKSTAELGHLPSKNHLALLQTCRRVLREAEDIFYTLHRFTYHSGTTHTLYNTVQLLNPHRRSAIQRLTIVASNGAAAFGVISELHNLPGLKSIYLERDDFSRCINISNWSLLAKQMRDALGKLEALEEVRVFTLEPSGELPP